uniref:Uncharacterized protein n=1 Tax=Rhizophora mucronata TaxID=61149 RepID=A0A2P2IZL6_RHIMU
MFSFSFFFCFLYKVKRIFILFDKNFHLAGLAVDMSIL